MSVDPAKVKDLHSYIDHYAKAQKKFDEALTVIEGYKSRIPKGKITRFFNKVFRTKIYKFEKSLIKDLKETTNKLNAMKTIHQGLIKQVQRMNILGEAKAVLEKAVAMSSAMDNISERLVEAKERKVFLDKFTDLVTKKRTLESDYGLRADQLSKAHSTIERLSDKDKEVLKREFGKHTEALKKNFRDLGVSWDKVPSAKARESAKQRLATIKAEFETAQDAYNKFVEANGVKHLTPAKLHERLATIKDELALLQKA